MKIWWQLKIISSGKCPFFSGVWRMFFRWHVQTQEQFNEQPKDEEYMEKLLCHRKFFATILKTSFIEWGVIGGIQSYNALHYRQVLDCMSLFIDTIRAWMNEIMNKSRMLLKKHQRTPCEQVEVADAVATSRTAAHMTSRFWDIENHVHTLIQEATAEMIRRDAHSADTLSQLRSAFQLYHLHAESQTDGFQRSQAGVRHDLERSNTYGGQFRSQYEETSTAIASIATEVSRLRAREEQLVTDVSTLQHRDSELQGQLQKSPPGECSDQCSRESNSHCKRFHAYKKQGIDAAVTDVQYRNRPSTSWSLWSSKFGWKKSIYRKSGTTAPLVTAPLETHRSLSTKFLTSRAKFLHPHSVFTL